MRACRHVLSLNSLRVELLVRFLYKKTTGIRGVTKTKTSENEDLRPGLGELRFRSTKTKTPGHFPVEKAYRLLESIGYFTYKICAHYLFSHLMYRTRFL